MSVSTPRISGATSWNFFAMALKISQSEMGEDRVLRRRRSCKESEKH